MSTPDLGQTTAPQDEIPNEKVIYLHGFSKQELFALVDLIKRNSSDPKSIAFATSTKNNMKLTVSELIKEVRKDHDYMTKGKIPPKG